MKNCLIVSYYFPPYSGIQGLRAYKFCKYLKENGWNPIVLTSSYKDPNMHDETLMKELDGRCKIYIAEEIKETVKKKIRDIRGQGQNNSGEAGKTGYQNNSLYSKEKLLKFLHSTIVFPDGKNTWYPPAVDLGRSLIKKYNIEAVFATGYPWTTLMVADKISVKNEIPLFVDIRDPWTLNTVDIWDSRINHYYEQKIFKNAKACIFTTKSTRDLYREKYKKNMNVEKFCTIYNGYDEEEYKCEEKDASEKREKFIISYTGTIASTKIPPETNKRTPYYFLLALKDLIEENYNGIAENVEARFIGGISQVYEEFVKVQDLKDYVEVLPYMPRSKVITEQMNSDVLLLLVAEDNRQFISSKIFEYIATNNNILALIPRETEVESIISEYSKGFVCSTSDIEHIKQSIKEMYDSWAGNEESNSYKSDVGNKYSRKMQTKQLAQLFDESAKK